MYYLCKFSGNWSLYQEKKGGTLLHGPEIEFIQAAFAAALREDAILDALLVAPFPANKLQQKAINDLSGPAGLSGAAGIYYLCRFFDQWNLFTKEKLLNKPMQNKEVELIKALFPDALNPKTLLDILIIAPIPPNRLQQLTAGGLDTRSRKQTVSKIIKMEAASETKAA